MIAAVQEQFPGLVMRRTSDVDAHRDLVRFTWAFGVPGADPVLAGLDVAKFDADGKLHRIIGFAGHDVPHRRCSGVIPHATVARRRSPPGRGGGRR